MSNLAQQDQVRVIFEEQLECREIQLPLLPKVAAMVIQLTTDDDADAQQLAKLIQSDQALAGHVMRIANSPIYRPVSAFVSLQQAIARLGIVTIGEIAMATSLNSDLFSAPGSEALLKVLWHKSLTCSAWARELARMRRTNVESSFLAGLLCTIGKPVVVQGIDDFQLDKATANEFIEQYYVRAGALLAQSWKLPEVVGQVIINHPEPDYTGKFEEEVTIVQASLYLTEEPDIDAFLDKMKEKLNFYPEDIELLEEKRAVVDAWVETMEIR